MSRTRMFSDPTTPRPKPPQPAPPMTPTGRRILEHLNRGAILHDPPAVIAAIESEAAAAIFGAPQMVVVHPRLFQLRHLLFAALLGLILGALAVRAVYAATPRHASELRWVPVHVEAPSENPEEGGRGANDRAPSERSAGGASHLPAATVLRDPPSPTAPLRAASTPGTILDPFPVSPPPERAAVEVPAAELVVREKATPRPATSGGWHVSVASWYGPGFYGHRTACGQTLTEGLVGVAHKTLACGTAVTFRTGGRVVTAPVVDRGPYIAGRDWDLTAGLCAALRACSTGPIEWRL